MKRTEHAEVADKIVDFVESLAIENNKDKRSILIRAYSHYKDEKVVVAKTAAKKKK